MNTPQENTAPTSPDTWTLEPMNDTPAQGDNRELINFTARAGYGRSAR